MKAKLVEDINFERGIEPSKSLNIGLDKKIKDKLSEMYHGEDGYRSLDYIYFSPDKIVIKYKDSIIKIGLEKDKDPGKLPLYLVKYSIIPSYISSTNTRKGSTWYDENETYNSAAVIERSFNNTSDPDHMKVKERTLAEIEYGYRKNTGGYNKTTEKEEAEKKVELMVNGLNKGIPPAEGFELIEEFDLELHEYQEKIEEIIKGS